jgi:hypothetical protein
MENCLNLNASVKHKSYVHIMPVKKKQKERQKLITVTARPEKGRGFGTSR